MFTPRQRRLTEFRDGVSMGLAVCARVRSCCDRVLIVSLLVWTLVVVSNSQFHPSSDQSDKWDNMRLLEPKCTLRANLKSAKRAPRVVKEAGGAAIEKFASKLFRVYSCALLNVTQELRATTGQLLPAPKTQSTTKLAIIL